MCYETKRKNKQKDLRKSFGLEDQESRKNTKQQKTKYTRTTKYALLKEYKIGFAVSDFHNFEKELIDLIAKYRI